MGISEDLAAAVANIFGEQWTKREGRKVPEAEDLPLGNTGVELEGVVLYADLSGSTQMVDNKTKEFSAEIYKTYLHCAAKIVQDEGGVVTAYDGDRLMAVFIGDTKNSSAARTGLKINHAVKKIINPALKAQYPKTTFSVQQVVGIDRSDLLVSRTGVRGANDLVWVGRAANHAAKLTELSADHPTWITHAVYSALVDDVKASQGKPMWEERSWTSMGGARIYRSNWMWKP
jgi:class 3 adenylate cyclase